jgi:hypothetical protein
MQSPRARTTDELFDPQDFKRKAIDRISSALDPIQAMLVPLRDARQQPDVLRVNFDEALKRRDALALSFDPQALRFALTRLQFQIHRECFQPFVYRHIFGSIVTSLRRKLLAKGVLFPLVFSLSPKSEAGSEKDRDVATRATHL